MSLFVLTLVVVALVMVIMAVGLFFRRPCLRGSCGGPDLFDSEGDSLTCAACPRRRTLSSGSAPPTLAKPRGEPAQDPSHKVDKAIP